MLKKLFVSFVFIVIFIYFFLTVLPYGNSEKIDLIRFEIHDAIVRLIDHVFPAYNKANLQSKIDKGPKQWMAFQIAQDIKGQKSVTEKDIDAYLASIPEKDRLYKYQMVKVVVDEDKVYTIPERLPYFDGRRRSVIEALERLQKLNFIKPCIFVLSVADLMPDGYKGQIPVFTYSKDLSNPLHKNLILTPDGMNLSRWGYIHRNIAFANKAYDWKDKKDLIFWRGSNTNKIREELIDLSQDRTHFDAHIPGEDKNGYTIPEMQVPYKYLISLDGVSSTWPGLLWKLASNSLTIKQDSPHIQWYYQALKPNVHYLPVNFDLSNLDEVYEYAKEHDTEMKNISSEAQKFIEENVLYEDMLVYMKFLMDAYQSKIYKLR